MTDPTLTPVDRLASAICATVRPDRDEDGERPCQVPCSACRAGAAAVLRSVVDQAVPEPPDCGAPSSDYVKGAEDRQRLVRFRLLSIATELEGPNG